MSKELDQALLVLSNDIAEILLANLEQDTFQVIKTHKKDKHIIEMAEGKVSSLFRIISNGGYIHEDDREFYDGITRIEVVKGFFKKNTDRLTLRYRLVGKNGSIIWVQMLIIPTENFTKENKEVYIYILSVKHEVSINREMEIVSANLTNALAMMKKENEILTSIATSFNSMHLFDFRNSTIREITSSDLVREVFDPEMNDITVDIQEYISNAMKKTMREESVEKALSFVDLSTLNDRLEGEKLISCELLSIEKGWVRATFIPVSRDLDNYLESFLFTTTVIDKEKNREENLIKLSNTDELTKLYNRRAYESFVSQYRKGNIPQNLALISFDVNGLKVLNDTEGHNAGDALLRGASYCMLMAFGALGKIFRTGGDEFIAVVDGTPSKIEKAINNFNSLTEKWNNDVIDTISVSIGFVHKKELPDAEFIELETEADKRMYKNKALYYKNLK